MRNEPTAGLDPVERVRFHEILASLQGKRIVILSTHIISDIELAATHLALLSKGRLTWTSTPEALMADAANSTWSLLVPRAEFEVLRATHRVSTAIPRGEQIEARILSSERPHPQAMLAEPTLEEAYLLFQEDAQVSSTASPKAVSPA